MKWSGLQISQCNPDKKISARDSSDRCLLCFRSTGLLLSTGGRSATGLARTSLWVFLHHLILPASSFYCVLLCLTRDSRSVHLRIPFLTSDVGLFFVTKKKSKRKNFRRIIDIVSFPVTCANCPTTVIRVWLRFSCCWIPIVTWKYCTWRVMSTDRLE